MKPLFITFEGPDGSGKTTISQAVYHKLIENGIDAVYTREPGGIDIAEQIRSVILDPKNTAMDKKTEALLYAASRRQHLVEKVLPALEKGQVVVCDRFIDSSLAYQGVGRQIGIDSVYAINEFAIEGHFPDATIFLKLDAKDGLDRISTRTFKDRLDQEDLSFHTLVAKGYELVLEKYKDRMHIIDASLSIQEITDLSYAYIKGLLDSHE